MLDVGFLDIDLFFVRWSDWLDHDVCCCDLMQIPPQARMAQAACRLALQDE